MNQILVEWPKVLRSRTYKQGKSYLRRQDNTFCCLGVLCDIVDPTGWRNVEDGRYLYKRSTDSKEHFGVLSKEIRQEIGLAEDHMQRLMSMNDGGKTFDEIANYIEQEIMVTKE